MSTPRSALEAGLGRDRLFGLHGRPSIDGFTSFSRRDVTDGFARSGETALGPSGVGDTRRLAGRHVHSVPDVDGGDGHQQAGHLTFVEKSLGPGPQFI